MNGRRGGSVYTVSQINSYIKNMFSQDFLLGRVYVKGEVSNCKYHQSGHIYFSLKDEQSAISCVLFAGNRRNVAFRVENGMQIIAFGSISTYERAGTYQLYASELRQDGLGILYERFEALKKELAEMGMFDPLYKQPIPSMVRTLGVVTAPTGAAVRDIIQISRRRSPGIRIFLYPAKVQGEGAAESICRGIRFLDRTGVDVIIIGRGGGSLEDLWAFNEEETARAVFACKTPVISAVGHETDTVITDYVADLRAPTPSAAAELAVPDMRAVLMSLDQYRDRLDTSVSRQISIRREQWEQLSLRLKLNSPRQKVAGMNVRADQLKTSLENLMKAILSDNKTRLDVLTERLESLSPYRRWEQGFALVTDADGVRIRSVSQTKTGAMLKIYLHDGEIHAQVEELCKKKTETKTN